MTEQYRVLKPGGKLIFEVPITDLGIPGIREKSTKRVDTSGSEDVFILEPVYHGDPVRSEGALVYTDWGLDIIEFLENRGFEVRYKSIEIPGSEMSHAVVFICSK